MKHSAKIEAVQILIQKITVMIYKNLIKDYNKVLKSRLQDSVKKVPSKVLI